MVNHTGPAEFAGCPPDDCIIATEQEAMKLVHLIGQRNVAFVCRGFRRNRHAIVRVFFSGWQIASALDLSESEKGFLGKMFCGTGKRFVALIKRTLWSYGYFDDYTVAEEARF